MIIEERLRTYINSLDSGNPPFLMELEEEAHKNYVPIIRQETQNLLKLLLAMNRPKRILEVGTAVGFSALLMEYYNPVDCHITTIENYAKKGQYIHFLPEVMRLLAPGGVLVSDNVLQDGDILESHFAVTRRNRTIHKRMREYLYELTHMDELTTSVLPIGDGVTISVRRDPLSGRRPDASCWSQ